MRTKHLPIADPCHENWDAMDRVARGRFCQVCVKQVYDLSSMTEPQARGLLQEAAGSRICVRYRHDDEGQIRFREPSPRARTCEPPRRRAWAGVVMAAAMAACTPHDNPAVPQRSPTTERAETFEERRVTMGSLQTPTEEPELREMKGQMIAIEPPDHALQGDVAVAPPEPRAAPIRERVGDVKVPTPPPDPAKSGILGQITAPATGIFDEPCDAEPGPKSPQ